MLFCRDAHAVLPRRLCCFAATLVRAYAVSPRRFFLLMPAIWDKIVPPHARARPQYPSLPSRHGVLGNRRRAGRAIARPPPVRIIQLVVEDTNNLAIIKFLAYGMGVRKWIILLLFSNTH